MKKTFLLIFFSWLLFFIIISPLQTPDETEHYENTFWVSRLIYPYQPKDKTRPRLFVNKLGKNQYYSSEEIKKLQPITLQSYHPPFYYFLVSLSHHISNLFHLDLILRFYLARLFSGFLFFGYVIIAYKILKMLFTKNYIISSLLLFFSINPLVVKSAVGINPDTGMTFFSMLFLYLIMRWKKTKLITLKQTIILSLVGAASTLSKLSGIFTFFVYSIYVYIKQEVGKKFFVSCLLFFLFAFTLLSPWFFMNLNRYNKLSPPAFSFAEYRELQPHGILQAMLLSAFEFRHTIMHYAGFLGPTNNINPPKSFFITYTIVLSILAFFGIITILKGSKKRKKFLWIIIHFFSLVFFLFILGTYFKKQGFSWDLQGRYFVPGFFALTIFIYFGVLRILKNNQVVAARILLLSAILHFYYILFFVLIPAYY